MPTRVGIVYLSVTVFIGVGAVNAQNNLLFFLFGISLAAILISGFISGSMMMGIKVQRTIQTPVYAKSTVVCNYTIKNTNRFIPAFAITLTEHKLAATTNATSKPTRRFPLHAFIPYIPPDSELTTKIKLPSPPRGELTIDKLSITSTFPFGIVTKAITYTNQEQLLVRPAIHPIAPKAFSNAAGAGRSTTEDRRRKGQGLEFYALREFAHADSPKQVAWKASARAGTLLTKQHASPTPKTLTVILMLEPAAEHSELERRIESAASYIMTAAAKNYQVALEVPHFALSSKTTNPGTRAAGALLDILALIDLSAQLAATAPLPRTTGPSITLASSNA